MAAAGGSRRVSDGRSRAVDPWGEGKVLCRLAGRGVGEDGAVEAGAVEELGLASWMWISRIGRDRCPWRGGGKVDPPCPPFSPASPMLSVLLGFRRRWDVPWPAPSLRLQSPPGTHARRGIWLGLAKPARMPEIFEAWPPTRCPAQGWGYKKRNKKGTL